MALLLSIKIKYNITVSLLLRHNLYRNYKILTAVFAK